MIKRLCLSLVIAAATLSGPSSWAQSGDAAYCSALTDDYKKYIASSSGRRMQNDLESDLAVDKCSKGDYAAGIPVLEKKLRDAGFTLPARK
jgi:hypothetical protein